MISSELCRTYSFSFVAITIILYFFHVLILTIDICMYRHFSLLVEAAQLPYHGFSWILANPTESLNYSLLPEMNLCQIWMSGKRNRS